MPAITLLDLENAHTDAIDIGLIVNGPIDRPNPGHPNGTVTTRLGSTVKSIPLLLSDALTALNVTNDYRDQALAARDLTFGYRDAALTARDLTITYRDAALVARNDTQTARTVATGYRDDILALKTQSTGLRNDIIQAKADAEQAVEDLLGDADQIADAVAQSAASATAANNSKVLAEAAASAAAQARNDAIGVTIGTNKEKVVRAVMTRNVALNGIPPANARDGVAIAADDRVGLVNQTNMAQNGAWIVKAGAWVRPADFDTDAEAVGSSMWATEGVTNAGRYFRLMITVALTLETTPLLFMNDTGGGRPLSEIFAKPGWRINVGPADSNWNGRIDKITAIPKILTGIGCPMEGGTILNMGQNGSQLAGWIASIISGDPDQQPADYSGITSPNNLHQVANGFPDAIICAPGINDYNSPANRAGVGVPTFYSNFDRMMVFLLQRSTCPIIAYVPQPYGGIDFTSGGFSTDWAADAALYGNANAADNAAYFSRLLRNCYLRWRNRHPRVHVFDTADMYNPGASQDETLHRCDDPNLNCLDPLDSSFVGQGSVTADVLTISSWETGIINVGRPINYNAVVSGAVVLSQLTNTAPGGQVGREGTYLLVAAPPGGDFATTQVTIFAKKINDGLHSSGNGVYAEFDHLVKFCGLGGRRARTAGIVGTQSTVPTKDDAIWKQLLANAHWSSVLFYNARSWNGTASLLTILPSPEAVIFKGAPKDRFSPARNGPERNLEIAETAVLIGRLHALRETTQARGVAVKGFVIGGTGTIYTGSVTFVNIAPNPFQVNINLTGMNLTAETAAGRLVLWVENADDVPNSSRKEIFLNFSGTKGAVYNPYATAWTPTQWQFARSGNTGTAATWDIRLHNQTDGRFVSGSVNFGTAAGMIIGTLTLASNVLAVVYTDSTFPVNATNLAAMIAAGQWPGPRMQLQTGYWMDMVPSVTTDPGTLVIR